jgi:hypothetical protein
LVRDKKGSMMKPVPVNVVATTKDWLRATQGIKLTAYEPPSIGGARSTSDSVFAKSDTEPVKQVARKKKPEK